VLGREKQREGRSDKVFNDSPNLCHRGPPQSVTGKKKYQSERNVTVRERRPRHHNPSKNNNVLLVGEVGAF